VLQRLIRRHSRRVPAARFREGGEARAIARFARARHWRSVIVVSSRYHLFRVRLLAHRCTGARLQVVPAPVLWWTWPKAIAFEWAKLAVAETTRRGC